MSVTVMNVSHYKREFNDFHALYEKGLAPDVYLFVYFIAPAVVILDGVNHVVDKNACIIYSPGHRQEYKHYHGTFINAFLIFKPDDPHYPARYGLPENEIFYVSNGDEISILLELITYCTTDKLIDRSHQIQVHVHKLFSLVADLYIDNDPKLKREQEIKQRFLSLRDEIGKDPKGWTVEKMAKRAWFTRSRFTVLYNEFLGNSPSVDLIKIKIEYAKKLLETSNIPISEVASKSGYKSVEHFIRIFTNHVDCTPLQYRKKHRHKTTTKEK